MKILPLSIIIILFLLFAGTNFVFAQPASSHVIGKIPFSPYIQNLMIHSCGRINDIGGVNPQVIQFVRQNNPNTAVTNDNVQEIFWNTLYTKFVSEVSEFKSLGGKNDTIGIKMGGYAALSCPPIQGGNATFQVNGNKLTYMIGFYSDSQAFYYKSISFIHTTQTSYNQNQAGKNNTNASIPMYGPGGPTVTIKIESPLKQFKSGILTKDVTCVQGLQLILKAEDDSPACVKPGSVSKLLIRGWAMLNLKDFGYNPGRGPAMTNASENSCGQFHTAPQNHNSTTVPVLLMNSNSTACVRLTFTIVSNYKDCNGRTCQEVLRLNSTLPIGNLHYEKHGDEFSVSAGKDFTNSFQITVIPETVDLENFSIGSNFTVTYIIRPLPNATGFYDQSIPKLACERYPLAVGYTADQVNYSNFSYIDPLNPPCASAGLYNLIAVEISGMSYKQVALP